MNAKNLFRQPAPFVAIIIFFAVCEALSSAYARQQDLDRYIASIRKARMSESAGNALRMVASIQTGAIIISFSKDEASGIYFTGYGSTMCPTPNADPEEFRKFQAAQEEKVQQEMKRLKPFADFDGSGFVSTAEGEEFRGLLEFGYKVSFVVKEIGSDLDSIAQALGTTTQFIKEEVVKYDQLVGRMKTYPGKPFPKIPPLASGGGTQ